MVQEWWAAHGTSINPDLLSTLGIVVFDKTGPIAVTHLYPAVTAEIVWMGFTARNPSLSQYKAGKALKLLIEAAEQAVATAGYKVLFTGFDASALIKLCAHRGYHRGGSVVEQWKVVNHV